MPSGPPDLTAVTFLRLPALWGAIQDVVHSGVHSAVRTGRPVNAKRPPLAGLSTTDSRARVSSPPSRPGGSLAVLARARAVASRTSNPTNSPRAAGDDGVALRHHHNDDEGQLPERMPRETLWRFLATLDVTAINHTNWSTRRQVSARLVALESIEAATDGGDVSVQPGVMSANLELANSYFMLGAHDLATSTCEELGKSMKAAQTQGLSLPGLLLARCHLMHAVCLIVEPSVDADRVRRCLSRARRACAEDPELDEDSEAMVEAGTALIEDLLATSQSDEHVGALSSASIASRTALRIAAAERTLSAAPAPYMKGRLQAELDKAVNTRQREEIEQKLEVDAAALRARAERLTLQISEDARVVDKAVRRFIGSLRSAAEPVDALLPLAASLCVVAGCCQWSAARFEVASEWLTLAAAAFEPPSVTHAFAEWGLTLVTAKASKTKFAVSLDFATAPVEASWIQTSGGEGHRDKRGGHHKMRGSGSDDDTASTVSSVSSVDSSDDDGDGRKQDGAAPHERLVRVWPEGRELLPYLRHALAAASSTPEGLHDTELAAHVAVATVDTFGRDAPRATKALKTFEARQQKVPPPRASPSWGVIEVMSTIQLSCKDPTAQVLYSTTGYPGQDDTALGTEVYSTPIVVTETGRLTLRMVSRRSDGRRSGVVELHFFVVLPSN